MRSALQSKFVLANLASMSAKARRGIPILLVYSNIASAVTEDLAEREDYYLLSATESRDTMESTRDLLHQRGWNDYHPPEGFESVSISLTPPTDFRSRSKPATIDPLTTQLAVTNEFSNSTSYEASHVNSSAIDQEETVLENFEGFVDYIEDSVAYVTLKSREHGDELNGEYPAAQLAEKGIKEQNKFICRTVRIGSSTRVDIQAVAKTQVTREQIQEIEEELNRILPDDDTVDY